MLMRDLNPNLRFGFLQVDCCLQLQVAPGLDLLALSPPVEDIPCRLQPDGRDIVRQHTAEIRGLETGQRQADIRNALGALEAAFEFCLPNLESRRTYLRPRLERQRVCLF